eukprot:scaffold291974_cov83-Cyclotella_meneghiniana.AAC.1
MSFLCYLLVSLDATLDIKTPKYRCYSSGSKSPATDAVTKNSTKSPRQIASDQSSFADSENGEGKSYTDSVKTKYYDKEASSISSLRNPRTLSATNPVSTPNYDNQQDMLEQPRRPIKIPTATRKATIETAEYPMEIEQLPKRNDVEPKYLTRPHYNL